MPKKGKKGGDDARPVRQVRTSCAFPPQALPHGVSWGFAKFVLLVTHVWLQPILDSGDADNGHALLEYFEGRAHRRIPGRLR